MLKDNQPETFAAAQELFAPEPCVLGFSLASRDDFQTVTAVSKGHGCIEKRTLTVSAALEQWGNWTDAAQVSKLERQVQQVGRRTTPAQIRYGLSSLQRHEVSPQRLLTLIRNHWQIEKSS